MKNIHRRVEIVFAREEIQRRLLIEHRKKHDPEKPKPKKQEQWPKREAN
jgi:hypothetical protein